MHLSISGIRDYNVLIVLQERIDLGSTDKCIRSMSMY